MTTLNSQLSRAVSVLDRFATFFGRIGAILVYALLVTMLAHVIMRYFFRLNLIQMEELHWHLYAAIFLLSLGYANVAGAHVRVDLFYDRMSDRGKAWVNLLGAVFLLLPFCAIISFYSFKYFWASWLVGEISQQPGALPARYILKFVLFLGMAILLTQAISIALRALIVLTGERANDETTPVSKEGGYHGI